MKPMAHTTLYMALAHRQNALECALQAILDDKYWRMPELLVKIAGVLHVARDVVMCLEKL